MLISDLIKILEQIKRIHGECTVVMQPEPIGNASEIEFFVSRRGFVFLEPGNDVAC